VKFPKENNRVGLVPDIWLSKDRTECCWPKLKNEDLFNRAVREMLEPGNWKYHPSVIIREKIGEYTQ
jgi:hypothetical protein